MRSATIWLGLIALLLGGCGGIEPPEPDHLTIIGSTAMAPLVESLASAYHEEHPHVTFSVEAQGSAMGLALARQGTASLGMVARPVTRPELFNPQSGRQQIWTTKIALDGLAIIVNPQNPLHALTAEQVRGLFTGQATRWVYLGWDGGDVRVVSREEGSGTRQVFEAALLPGAQPTLNAIVTPTSSAMLEYVAAHREAVGYVSMGLVGDDVKPIALDNVLPTAATVASGTYPVVRPFLLVNDAEPPGEVRAFLQFASGPAGRAIISQRFGLPGNGL